jgi:hypothetical protein
MSTNEQPESADEQRLRYEREDREDAEERERSGEAEQMRQFELDAPAREQREVAYWNALAVKFGFSIEPRYNQCLIRQPYFIQHKEQQLLIGESLVAFADKNNEADQAHLLMMKGQVEAEGRTCELTPCGWLYSALAELAERNTQNVISFWMEYHGFTLFNDLRRKLPPEEQSRDNHWFSPIMQLYSRDPLSILFEDYAQQAWQMRRAHREKDPNLALKQAIANQAQR